jgi:plasmid stability protein
MKMTIDLPSNLVREMKLRAAHEGRKIRDVATEIFREGLAHPPSRRTPAARPASLPLIACRKASGKPTPEFLADVLLKQEASWTHESSGR